MHKLDSQVLYKIDRGNHFGINSLGRPVQMLNCKQHSTHSLTLSGSDSFRYSPLPFCFSLWLCVSVSSPFSLALSLSLLSLCFYLSHSVALSFSIHIPLCLSDLSIRNDPKDCLLWFRRDCSIEPQVTLDGEEGRGSVTMQTSAPLCSWRCKSFNLQMFAHRGLLQIDPRFTVRHSLRIPERRLDLHRWIWWNLRTVGFVLIRPVSYLIVLKSSVFEVSLQDTSYLRGVI